MTNVLYVADFYRVLKILRNVHFHMKFNKCYNVHEKEAVELYWACGMVVGTPRPLSSGNRDLYAKNGKTG